MPETKSALFMVSSLTHFSGFSRRGVVQLSSDGLLWYLSLPKADRRPRRKHAKIKIEIEKNALEILPI